MLRAQCTGQNACSIHSAAGRSTRLLRTKAARAATAAAATTAATIATTATTPTDNTPTNTPTTTTTSHPPPTNHLAPQPIVIVITNENDSCRRCRGSGPLSVTAAEVADAHLP